MAKYRFGDICEVLNGRAYKQNELLSSGKYPILRVGNFFSSDRWYYSDMELPENKYCDYEDLLFAWSASFGPKIWDGGKVIYHYHIWKLIPNDDVADKFYLYYWLQHSVNRLTAGTHGSVMAHMTKGDMENQSIELPSLQTQKKISSILRTIDEKIHNNEAINNNLEQQAMALYKSWFVDFELNSGVMPSDWKVSQLGSIAKISTEVFSPAKNPNVEVEHYSIPAYDEKHYPIFETSNGIKSNKYRLTSNSVMISKLNPDTKRIWRPYCISDNPICSTEFIVYEPIKPLNRDFIYSIIDSIGFSAFLCSHTTGSTNSRQRATPGITLTYDIVVPDEKTIQAFCSIVSPMYDTIENNIKENQKLAETRDNLLPKLMSGELDVSDIEL